MSRTYRFRKGKDRYLIEDQRLFTDWGKVEFEDRNGQTWEYFGCYRLDPKSKEGRKALAQFHSDKKDRVMIWNGPSWYHREFSQKPYRTRAKKEIFRFFKNPEYEVIIENKPPREYWW